LQPIPPAPMLPPCLGVHGYSSASKLASLNHQSTGCGRRQRHPSESPVKIRLPLRRPAILPSRSPLLLRLLRLHLLLRLLPWIAALPGLVLAQPAQQVIAPGQPEQAQLAKALRQGGLVVLLRHAETDPGVGDPAGFRADDCPTQRNLNDAGRAQARRLGEWFRQHGIAPTRVMSSPWCRARETARLAFGGAEDWMALSNLIADRSRQDDHGREVLEAIARVGPEDLIVLVSHGVTINAFIGEYLRQGELVIVRPAAGAAAARKSHAGPISNAVPAPRDGRAVEIIGRLLVP
jgi:phosphohistidine phosphatase SixA